MNGSAPTKGIILSPLALLKRSRLGVNMDIDNYDIFIPVEFICVHDWEWEPFESEPDIDQPTHARGVWLCLCCGEENSEKEEPGDYYYGDECF